MAVNLIDSVKDAIAGQVADQIGSAVGLDKQQTASALKMVVPMLIGSMANKASTPSGASELASVLKNTDTSILDNLGGLLGGGSSSSNLLSMGTKLLPMLLGASQGNIISTLVRLLGMNDKSVGGLLGTLAPIVMAVVGKQAKSAGGFDVGAITNLLGGQKNFLSSAVPSELKGVMGLASDVAGAASRTVEAAKPSNPLNWLLPLVGLGLLGFLGYNFLFKKPAENKPAVPSAAATAEVPKIELPEVPDLTNLKKSLTDTFEGLTGTLGNVKDLESAKSALPKLEEAAKAYGTLGVDKLPGVAQKTLIPFLQPYLTKLQEVLDGLYKIPGVKDIVEPVIGPMVKTVQAVGL